MRRASLSCDVVAVPLEKGILHDCMMCEMVDRSACTHSITHSLPPCYVDMPNIQFHFHMIGGVSARLIDLSLLVAMASNNTRAFDLVKHANIPYGIEDGK